MTKLRPDENDDQQARSIVETLKAALPPSGYLAIYEASDADPQQNEATRIYNESGAVPYHLRRPEQIARFFDGLELATPGLVPIQEWRPEHSPFGNSVSVPALGGVAKKSGA